MTTSAEYVAPASLDEALEALRGATERTVLLAGGTDLMVEFESGRTAPDRVVALHRVEELRGIALEGEDLRVGAGTTCSELLRSRLARERARILVEAADEVGAEQIKNRATLGGNLGTASPAADLVPCLLALRARVRLRSMRGARELPVAEFLTGYRRTARRPEELIESVLLPAPPPDGRSAFRKVGTRRAQSISKVVLALSLRFVEGRMRDVRAAAGSIAPTTVLLGGLARELEASVPSPELLRDAWRRAAREEISPIDDVRSTAQYRRLVLARVGLSLTSRLVELREPS